MMSEWTLFKLIESTFFFRTPIINTCSNFGDTWLNGASLQLITLIVLRARSIHAVAGGVLNQTFSFCLGHFH